jgi:hypothetical protein
VLLSLFYFLSLSRISEKSENSHHAKIVNYTAFREFLQMVPKHNFIEPFKLFFFIGYFWCEFLVIIWTTLFSSLLFFQQAGSMPGGATWAGSQWNHVWVSPQLLKNSFSTSGQAGFEPTPFVI